MDEDAEMNVLVEIPVEAYNFISTVARIKNAPFEVILLSMVCNYAADNKFDFPITQNTADNHQERII